MRNKNEFELILSCEQGIYFLKTFKGYKYGQTKDANKIYKFLFDLEARFADCSFTLEAVMNVSRTMTDKKVYVDRVKFSNYFR